MNESAIVVGVHAMTLLFFIGSAVLWVPWVARNLHDVVRNPMGVLVIAFGVMGLLAAMNALYYGIARVMHDVFDISLWNQEWAFLIALIQAMASVGFLLSMVAQWRVRAMPAAQIKLQVVRAMLVGFALFSSVAFGLW